MARRTSAQRRAKKREVRAAVARTRADLPTLDSFVEPEKKPVQSIKPKIGTSMEQAFAPDDTIVSSVKKGKMSERKSAEERQSLRWRGMDDIEPAQQKRVEELRREAVQKALDALQELDFDPDSTKELNRITRESKEDEMIFN